ncbi:unnamed protein product [Fusarium graminearum]|uniref:BAH domain-containing protein n=1 Tax=Gibberella zeae TaxID=5518 RepID=A0A9N8NJF3_GIBZA|nr:unnamed protein product [Fusarium graminearum]
MNNQKRSRSVQEKKYVVCPFTITYAPGPSRADEGHHDNKKFQIENSPFSPTGSFKTHDSLDIYYTVEPTKRWHDMTRYNSFVLNNIKYYKEGFIYVANESTVNYQKAINNSESGYKKSNSEWVARILDICASSEHNVYARVYWMYWPEELPSSTIYHKMRVQGRQSYHGTNELIASNYNDEEIEVGLYWRQAYSYTTSQLSSVRIICKCEIPANPDKMLIGCSRSESVLNEEEAKNVPCYLLPTGAEKKEAICTIDVHSEKSRGDIYVKEIVPETPLVTRNSTSRPTPSKSIIATPAKRPAKNDQKKKMGSFKLYARLFEANLKMQEGPTVWEIRDLRESVTGGEKTWTEKAYCLICGTVID